MCGEMIRLQHHVTALRTTDGTTAETGHGSSMCFSVERWWNITDTTSTSNGRGCGEWYWDLISVPPVCTCSMFKVTEPSILETKRMPIAMVVLQWYLKALFRLAHSSLFSSQTSPVWQVSGYLRLNIRLWLQIECHLSHRCPEVME